MVRVQGQGHVWNALGIGWGGRCGEGARDTFKVRTSLTPRGPEGPRQSNPFTRGVDDCPGVSAVTAGQRGPPNPPHPTQNPHHSALVPRPTDPAPCTLTTAGKRLPPSSTIPKEVPRVHPTRRAATRRICPVAFRAVPTKTKKAQHQVPGLSDYDYASVTQQAAEPQTWYCRP